MFTELQPPFVSEYLTWEIDYKIQGGQICPGWKTRNPQVVNTVDIEEALRTPNVFLWGWTEIHHEIRATQVPGGQMIPFNREKPIRKTHPINHGLIQMLGDMYNDAAGPPSRVIQLRSFEQILFSLGWRFDWKPLGPDVDDLMGIVPDVLKPMFADQMEIQLWLKYMERQQNAALADPFKQTPQPEPGWEQVVPTPTSDPASDQSIYRLELKVDQMADSINTLVKVLTQNATSHTP